MELQADDYTKNPPAISEAISPRPARPTLPPSTSVPSLRFPKPQVNHHLADWISNSSPDIMQPSNLSDAGSLTDSAYELINSTDGEVESQDGHMAESIGSLGVSRPEDVQSLDGSDDGYNSSDDDEEADDHSASDVSIRYADASLQNPSTQPPINNFKFGLAADNSTPLVQSIEFQEAIDLGNSPIIEKVSVKHTIREFNEDESAVISKDLGMPETPKRMVATIRQTMSQGCLSTKEALRVLYVGSPAGQKDIIYKLSSAIWASGTVDSDKIAYRETEGVYNIVPISSFGSTKEPEIQLMETSGYQIKVEHCTSAEEIVYEGQFFPSDTVYSLTIDQERVYRSLYNPSGSAIQPRWILPHIAIFYLTENDDEQAEKTRHAAWKFMKRHGIPSIFISHSPAFVQPSAGNWGEYVDHHAIHMCLESRDPDVPNVAERLPIDFSSFINIDARQMNRNLSYLTGLVEPVDSTDQGATTQAALDSTTKLTTKSKAKAKLQGDRSGQKKLKERKNGRGEFWRTWQPNELGADEITCIRISLAVLVAVISLAFSPTLFAWMRPGDVASNQASVPPVLTAPATSLSSIRSTTSTKQASASTSTVVISVTSTKTIKISKAEPTASSLASALSFAGFLSDKPSSLPSEPDAKKSQCSVEIYSPSEILIKLPGQTTSTFLAKGAIRLAVYRGEESIKWQRLSSIEDGLLVDIGKENAHGVLNVSVITTRKPKINDTFEVNFGKPVVAEVVAAGMHLLQDIAHKVASTADEAAHLVDDTCRPAAFAGIERLREDAAFIAKNILSASKTASRFSSRVAEDTVNQVKNSLNPAEVAQFLKNAQDQFARQVKSAENMRNDVSLSVTKAQIASKLWWLKLQGKDSEYEEYERKATKFLKTKHTELKELQKLRSSSEDCGLPGTSKHRKCQKQLKKLMKSKDASRWKRMITG